LAEANLTLACSPSIARLELTEMARTGFKTVAMRQAHRFKVLAIWSVHT
jgi:hypothetical protein